MKNRELINEHDQTKRMLDVMRYGLIKEAQGGEIPDDNEESPDTISPSKNDSVYKEEEKKLMDSVTPMLRLTRFKIYPKNRDVQIDGRLDCGINFFLSTMAQKLKISITDDNGDATEIYLDAELLATIQKLSGYYTNWSKEWATKLSTEYKSK